MWTLGLIENQSLLSAWPFFFRLHAYVVVSRGTCKAWILLRVTGSLFQGLHISLVRNLPSWVGGKYTGVKKLLVSLRGTTVGVGIAARRDSFLTMDGGKAQQWRRLPALYQACWCLLFFPPPFLIQGDKSRLCWIALNRTALIPRQMILVHSILLCVYYTEIDQNRNVLSNHLQHGPWVSCNPVFVDQSFDECKKGRFFFSRPLPVVLWLGAWFRHKWWSFFFAIQKNCCGCFNTSVCGSSCGVCYRDTFCHACFYGIRPWRTNATHPMFHHPFVRLTVLPGPDTINQLKGCLCVYMWCISQGFAKYYPYITFSSPGVSSRITVACNFGMSEFSCDLTGFLSRINQNQPFIQD